MKMNKKLASNFRNLVRQGDKEINSDNCKRDLAKRLKNKIIARKSNLAKKGE